MTADDHFDAGNLCELHEDFFGAIEHYSKAIELQPHFPEAYFNRAGDYRLLEDFDSSIADYEMAIKQMPDDALAYQCLATILLRADDKTPIDYNKGLSLAVKACQITEYQDHSALSTLAMAAAKSNRFGQAAKWQRTAIGILEGRISVAHRYEPPIDAEIHLHEYRKQLADYVEAQRQTSWFKRIKAFALGR